MQSKSPENTKTLSAPLKRITVLDALRGFALLGVILIHMLQRFGIPFLPSGEVTPMFPAMDETVKWIGQNVIMGRFINIFAFLFGLSFFIQMDSAARKGIDFRWRFIWRMILLLLIGVLAHSFYSLEILSVYAVFGLLMIPLYGAKKWVLLVIACFLLLGGPRLIQANLNNRALSGQTTDQVESSNAAISPAAVPAHLSNPSFWNSVKYNYEERFTGKLNYQFGMIGRGFVTFAIFLLGLVVGRLRFFEKIDTRKRRNVILFVAFAIASAFVSWLLGALPAENTRVLFIPEGTFISGSLLVVQALQDINLVLFSGALAMGFIILYQTTFAGRILDTLSPYGRMGLTNYLVQGLVGCLIFSPWAFGPIFSNWGVTELFIFGIAIYIVQIIFSKYWLSRFLYGPLEWLWRSATYLKLQPFRKPATTRNDLPGRAGS